MLKSCRAAQAAGEIVFPSGRAVPSTIKKIVKQSGHRRLGGGDRDRTDDLLLAKQVLSQLSYAPPVTPSRLYAKTGAGG